MIHNCTIVVDIGKTNSKISLWDEQGSLVDRKVRSNEQVTSSYGYPCLDTIAIEKWLLANLADLASNSHVKQIVPVAHGAAAALLKGDKLLCDPVDYEIRIAGKSRYDAERDSFHSTGSPTLPSGLNLGRQLHFLEELLGPIPASVTIVTWPQYWAWRFSGVAATEVSSLGCHTDLWCPEERQFSAMATSRGWSANFAPLRRADNILGPITSEIVRITGLNSDCQVLCGLHDSNAALLAARGHEEVSKQDSTILSTGTWFVAMRTPRNHFGTERLDEDRDCLVNVDVFGRPIPSSRFMGGREAGLIAGIDSFRLTDGVEAEVFLQKLPALLRTHSLPKPTYVAGVGPYAACKGTWANPPEDPIDQRVLTHFYLALVANCCLELIDSRECLLVEGRFAEDPILVHSLAALRKGQSVYTSNAEHDVAYGALRLTNSSLPPSATLKRVDPLPFDVNQYASQWRSEAEAARGGL